MDDGTYRVPMPHHDLVIVGTGSGNTIVTPELEGLDIAIIESGRFGGTCLNVGCIPTKMFVLPADRVVEARESAALGVTFGEPTVDWPAIRDRIFERRIDPIAAAGEEYRRSQPFVTVYGARARFVGQRRLALTTGEEVTGRHVVVAAGSRPVGLPVDGLRMPDPARGLHTSDTVMRLDALPARMVILGGGYVACEFAHVFSAFGVAVTQVQRSDVLLSRHERALGEAFTASARERYRLLTSTRVVAADRDEGGTWHVTVTHDGVRDIVLDAEVVLLAVGRTPNSDELDAHAGGMATMPDGTLVVDAHQRTTAPDTWALGDICGAWQLKHVANHEARVVAHNLAVAFGRTDAPYAESDHRFVPAAVFGHPQVAGFGPTSAELDEAGTAYVSATQAYGDVAYGWALEDRSGFLTVHASPDGHILAAHCIGPAASTVIQPLIQAASFGQRARDVARAQYWIHPALAEVVENALLGLPGAV